MMNVARFKMLVSVVCALVLLLAVVSCKGRQKAVVGEGQAPDFTLSDINGGKVTLADFRGKVVVVEFWATWCPPCRESVPEMKSLYEKFKGKDFELLGISLDQGGSALSDVTSFAREQGIGYPVLMDDDKTSAAFGVTNIPAVFVVDKQGKIARKYVGLMPGLSESLSKEIEGLL